MKGLDEIKERLNKATPSPWEKGIEFRLAGVNDGSNPYWNPSHIEKEKCHWCDTFELLGTVQSNRGNMHVHADLPEYNSIVNRNLFKTIFNDHDGQLSSADAEFIAHSREDIERLVARVEKLENALQELRELAYYDDIRDSFEVTLACDKALAEEDEG